MTTRLRADVLAWLALLALLALTCGSAFIPMGRLNAALNLLIAAAKALLVVIVFMQVGKGGAAVRLFAASGFLWLALLAGLSAADFAVRGG